MWPVAFYIQNIDVEHFPLPTFWIGKLQIPIGPHGVLFKYIYSKYTVPKCITQWLIKCEFTLFRLGKKFRTRCVAFCSVSRLENLWEFGEFYIRHSEPNNLIDYRKSEAVNIRHVSANYHQYIRTEGRTDGWPNAWRTYKGSVFAIWVRNPKTKRIHNIKNK